MHLRLAAEPGQLPLGVVAMALLGGGYAPQQTQDSRSTASACR
jgi:hypothetical protein